jgi:hypothetical protein
MSQKSSFLQPANSVSQVLIPDSRQMIIIHPCKICPTVLIYDQRTNRRLYCEPCKRGREGFKPDFSKDARCPFRPLGPWLDPRCAREDRPRGEIMSQQEPGTKPGDEAKVW